MLGTLMTMLFLISRAVGQFEIGVHQRQEPRRYQVFQPLPWQLHNVSRNRKSSRADKKDSGSRRSSVNSSKASTARGMERREENICMDPSPERAAITIQKQYRRYQECKKHETSP
ncbi:uncharacterized protein LOC134341021 isoform X1 [Mobula hypostoma]|uniref:uncharacterized protein LOC134341021 isoform X1 n=1 Tax=Mobula hypostoma TaxID=723540 RepID=UPI002FC3AB72